MSRPVPAQQRFVTRNLARACVDQRLEVHVHGLFRERASEVRFKVRSDAGDFVHATLEETGAATALRLGAIERQLGVLHEHGGIGSVVRRKGDADAAAGQNILAVDRDRREQGVDDEIGQFDGFFGQHVALQDCELVAAKSSQECRRADAIQTSNVSGRQFLIEQLHADPAKIRVAPYLTSAPPRPA